MRSRPGRETFLGAAYDLMLLTISQPSRLAKLVRFVGASGRDWAFWECSPLKVLPEDARVRLGLFSATLPPAVLLGPGNQDARGLAYLVALGKALNAKTIFEIGTYNGVTALTLARNLLSATVNTLDLPAGKQPRYPLLASAGDLANLANGAHRAYEGRPEAVRIRQFLEDSARFDFSPFESSAQLVYVDGAHSTEYLKNDTEAAFRIVADPGVVVWDDYWRRVPTVAHYLERLNGRLLYRLPDSRLIIWLTPKAKELLLNRHIGPPKIDWDSCDGS